MTRNLALTLALATLAAGCAGPPDPDHVELLNVSYDPTRELYEEINAAFVGQWQKDNPGKTMRVKMSHGGSAGQARAVIEGLEADVVTLALWNDVDALRSRGDLLDDDWASRPPNGLPYYSTIVFVVRRGDDRVADWEDLKRDDVKVVTPNPKTSGNGRLSFLAAYGAELRRTGSVEAARAFVRLLYDPATRKVPKLDTGARGASLTFQQGTGDVHLTWENEARLEVAEAGGALKIVYPKTSIRAEPYVALVPDNLRRKGPQQEEAARRYLEFLYTDAAQEIIARHGYRPRNEAIRKRHEEDLPSLDLFGIDALGVRDWQEAHEAFFKDGALFDRIIDRN
jgi:sulfate transport system substrate-binding protein